MPRDLRATHETERLRLRPLVMSDGDQLFPLQRNPAMMRYFGGPYVRAQSDTWLEWHVALWEHEGYSHWAVELKEDDTFIGWIGLTKVWEPEELLPATEVGWFIDQDHWGAGLATEGGKRSLAFGFEELSLDRIIARYNTENDASGRVMEKLGMSHACDMERSDGLGTSRVFEIQADEFAW